LNDQMADSADQRGRGRGGETVEDSEGEEEEVTEKAVDLVVAEDVETEEIVDVPGEEEERMKKEPGFP